MNQLITITFLFIISSIIGFSQTPTDLKIDNKAQVTFLDLESENTVAQDLISFGVTAEMFSKQIKTDMM